MTHRFHPFMRLRERLAARLPSAPSKMPVSKSLLSGLVVTSSALVCLVASSRPAHAGHWQVKYMSNYTYIGKSIVFDKVGDPNNPNATPHLAAAAQNYQTNLHWYPGEGGQGEHHIYKGIHPPNSQGETDFERLVDGTRGHEEGTYYSENRGNGIGVSFRPLQPNGTVFPNPELNGGQMTAICKGDLSITAQLTWVSDSPGDTPPEMAYFVEKASVEGSESGPSPIMQSLFSYNGVQCPFTATDPGKKTDPNDQTDHTNQVFQLTGSGSYAAGYTTKFRKGQGFNVYQLKNPDHRTSIDGPTRRFGGSVTMSADYYNEDYVGMSGEAGLAFNYTFTPATNAFSFAWDEGQDVVAAGAKDTEAHKSTFTLTFRDADGTPVSGVDVPKVKVLSGGKGPQDDVTATVELDSTTTDSNGKVTGTFHSGNRVEPTTIGIKGGASATVNQVWNSNSDPWSYDAYFDYDTPSSVSYKMSYVRGTDPEPIAGHSMHIENTSITGWELVPASYDWDGDGTLDDTYYNATFTPDDEDTLGWDEFSGLSSWGSTSESPDGTYNSDQTISWSDDFIVDSVDFDVVDDDAFGPLGDDSNN